MAVRSPGAGIVVRSAITSAGLITIYALVRTNWLLLFGALVYGAVNLLVVQIGRKRGWF